MEQIQTAEQAEQRAVRRGAVLAAVTVLTLIVVEALQDFALLQWQQWEYASFERFVTRIHTDLSAYLFYEMTMYVSAMGTAALVGWLLLRRRGATYPCKRVNGGVAAASLLGGVALCIGADILNNVMLSYLEWFGVYPTEFPTMQDGTWSGFLLNLLSVVVLPALLEELVFRGAVLTALRPAGDTVAVFVSALLFGLMHERLQQIPFAFLLGLVFGYLTVKTGNILLAMALHALNNALSVVLEYATWTFSEAMASRVYAVTFVVVAMLGATAFCVLLLRKRTAVPPVGDHPRAVTSTGKRLATVFTTPLCIVVLVLLVFLTAQNTEVRTDIQGETEESPSSYMDTV